MSWERELEKELRKLKKAFWKMFIKSREFKNFRRRLKELHLDADIFLAMFIFGEHRASIDTTRPTRVRASRRKKESRLTKEDKDFLRMHGIRWD